MKSFRQLAKYYDFHYKDKDYSGECDFLENVFRKYSKRPQSILDIGCGTGNHAIQLDKRGYNVVGVDISEDMIEQARIKSDLAFHVGDMCNFQLEKKFDASICMYAAMNYITKTEDILKALKNIKSHLKKNGLFIFDFWNGLAVLRILPSLRFKIVEEGNRKLIKTTNSLNLDSFNHIFKWNIRYFIIENNILIDDVMEKHVVRFFFPQEIIYLLKEAGFKTLEICPFLDLGGKIDENIWNVACIAK